MAFSFSQSSLVLLVLLLAFVSGCFADLIADVCTKAQNSSLCNEVFRSAHNRSPNLKLLGNIAFTEAQAQTFKLQIFLRSLARDATDQELKDRYLSCLVAIDYAVEKLSDSGRYFYAKNYFNMFNEIAGPAGALKAEAYCDRKFEKPPNEPVLLKQANQKAQDIASMLAAVANALLKAR